MFNCLQIMCANTLSLGIMFKKIAPRQIWRVCLIQRQIRVIFGVGFERGKVYLKKQCMPLIVWVYAYYFTRSFNYL